MVFMAPHRIAKLGALIKPTTLFKFDQALVNRKYRLFFSPTRVAASLGSKA